MTGDMCKNGTATFQGNRICLLQQKTWAKFISPFCPCLWINIGIKVLWVTFPLWFQGAWLKCWFTLAHSQGQEQVPCRLMDMCFPKISCHHVYLSQRECLGCTGNENNEGFENPWLPAVLTSFRQPPKQFCLLHSQAWASWEKLLCGWVMIFLSSIFRW